MSGGQNSSWTRIEETTMVLYIWMDLLLVSKNFFKLTKQHPY